jgi:exonuclease SbcC
MVTVHGYLCGAMTEIRIVALSRQISIGDFRRRIRPSALVIREQKQWSSRPPWRASRQYRIYSDNADRRARRHAGARRRGAARRRDPSAEIDAAKAELAIWQAVADAVGSASGDRFRRFVQGVTLDHLVRLANDRLDALSPRYRLARGASSDLTLHVVDRDMGDEVRATRSLSGGERFLVSLALALALSAPEGRASFVDTLFIDEGFGSLDAETLDMAIDALETLQGRGQKVGVVTHVAAMIDRIAVQVRVEKRGAGRSEIRVCGGSAAGAPP